MISDDIYCNIIEHQVMIHLMKCSFDDCSLALLELGSALAGVYYAVKQNFGDNDG